MYRVVGKSRCLSSYKQAPCIIKCDKSCRHQMYSTEGPRSVSCCRVPFGRSSVCSKRGLCAQHVDMDRSLSIIAICMITKVRQRVFIKSKLLLRVFIKSAAVSCSSGRSASNGMHVLDASAPGKPACPTPSPQTSTPCLPPYNTYDMTPPSLSLPIPLPLSPPLPLSLSLASLLDFVHPFVCDVSRRRCGCHDMIYVK